MKKFTLGIILGILLIGIISAQCCERTLEGAWCQNAEENECDVTGDLRSVPTSCESTSYCRLGTCINTREGTCMPNSPQSPCIDPNGDGDFSDGGEWDERDKADIPQCQLGCCLIGEQAAFVTQTRCKTLSSIYGLETNYRTDIANEVECISSASPDVKGACVFEEEYQKNCKMTTKKECQDMGDTVDTEFYEGYLCSAESLETICGPRGGTTCVDGRDEIYFLDTCGNLANIYDDTLIDDQDYWTFIQEPDCDDGAGNQDSATCGACDYFLGSTCKEVERGENVNYGNYICKDLDCEFEGNTYSHGETWCADARGVGNSLVGSRYFRMVCYNGEVSVEPCADYRQETCIQSDVNGFSSAACRVNRWQDCYSQTNEKDCTNGDKRDCQWLEGASILLDEDGDSLAVDEEGQSIDASCVPEYAPGFNFWEDGGDASDMCAMANTQCVVYYEASIGDLARGERGEVVEDPDCYDLCREEGGDRDECKEDCKAKCVEEDGKWNEEWKDQMVEICNSLGDCGSKDNYVGDEGYYNEDNSFVREEAGEEEE